MELAHVGRMASALARILEPDDEWNDFSMGALVDHAMSRHVPARLLVPVLLEGAKTTESITVVPLSLQVIELTADLLTHMWQEEQLLFPYLRRLESWDAVPEPALGGVQSSVAVMLRAHRRFLEDIRRMKRVTAMLATSSTVVERDRDFCERVAGLCGYLEEHVRFENDVLFPRALAMTPHHR